MKKAIIFSATAFTFLFAGYASAQVATKSTKGERTTRAAAADKAEIRAQKLVERWNKELSLNEAQKERIHRLAVENFKSGDASQEAQVRLNEEMTQILTPEQRSKKTELDRLKQAKAATNNPNREVMKSGSKK
jgi:Spy/CpxP family protein refolding chaperone